MSERTPFTSPPPYTQSGDDTNSSITGGGGGGEKRNGIGAGSAQDLRQNHAQTRAPLPHELTAEWTVRAQLTFARAGEKVQREFSSNDPLNPVRVVYKWSTLDATAAGIDNEDDLNDEDAETTSTLRRTTSSQGSRQSTPLKRAMPAAAPLSTKHHPSFRSTSSSVGGRVDGDGGADSAFSGSRSSRPTTLSSSSKEHSTTAGPNGTGMAAAAFYGTRCRSTCNIVVSAVADFLPPNAANTDFLSKEAFLPATRATTATDFVPDIEPDPFVYNTTASYTVLPQQDDNSTTAFASKNFKADLRDAVCQTSDTETKFFEEKSTRQDSRRSQATQQHHQQQDYQRRPYDQRRLTAEGLLQPSSVLTPQSSRDDNEGNIYMHSKTPSSTSNTFKSASMSRIPQLLKQQQQQVPPLTKAGGVSSTDPQKKPRTVHIDVYCTGSEDDDQADGEASSSSENDDSKRHEVDSTSTRQTVLDNEQMRLRHQRVSGTAMPRRLANQQHQQQKQQQQRQQKLSSQSDLNVGHAVTKSSTAEEVSESKQLLFRKHIGDQRAAKLATLRQKYLRQTSDDALSSTYPNSSRSTVRDNTCSSISSAINGAAATDAPDSSWKETAEEADDYQSLAKSDSFEYANSVDRLRIRQMEKHWSRDDDIGQPPPQHMSSSPTTKPNYLQTISEVNSQPSSPYRPSAPLPFFQRNDTINSDLENFSENDVFYSQYPSAPKSQSPLANYQRQFSPLLPQPMPKTPTPSPPKALKPTPLFLQQTSHFPRNRPGFLQFFGPGNQPPPPTSSPLTVPQSDPNSPIQPLSAPVGQLLYPNYQPNLQRWKSEARDNLSSSITPVTVASEQSQHTSPQPSSSPYTPSPQRCGSEAPPTTTSAVTFPYQSNIPIMARRFDLHRDSPASVSETSTVLSGYTPEYLEKARKFGKVVNTVRKPGHHVGPTKNPNCTCESCQRWLAERFQLRGRAFSLGERPILKRPTKF